MNPLTTALADHFGRPRRAHPIRQNHAARICPSHASKIPSNHASKIRPIDGSLWPSRDGSDRAVLDSQKEAIYTAYAPRESDLLAVAAARDGAAKGAPIRTGTIGTSDLDVAQQPSAKLAPTRRRLTE